MLQDRLFDLGPETFIIDLATRCPDDLRVVGDQALDVQVVESGKQFPLRQVAGSSEDDDDAWIRDDRQLDHTSSRKSQMRSERRLGGKRSSKKLLDIINSAFRSSRDKASASENGCNRSR